jgi:hypothetical protein
VSQPMNNGPGTPEAAASLTIESVPALVRAHPDALLSDAVLGFACALDDVSFERLRKRLSDQYVRTADLQAFVRAVRAQSKAANDARKSSRKPERDDRPQIVITTDEGAVNEQAAAALVRIAGLFSRMGELVRVIESKRRRPGEADPYSVTEIRVVTEPLLRELMARSARWVEVKEDPHGGSITMPAHPPEWCVKAVRAWHDWPELPPLYHVAESPVLLADGRVIQRAGYDAPTGILCGTKIEIRESSKLTREGARAAAKYVLDLVSQVPFEDDVHRSSFLAALLTPIARWAFKGQCPLFMFDANKEGTGKGFLVNIISGIALGHPCDVTVQTADEDEERKFITSKILTAQPIVLIDECDKPFGSGALQGVLTSGVWSPRLLGTNDSPSYPAYIVWFAAGNNVQLKSGDIARRTCFVRIVTGLDNPAERVGFKIEDMPAHVEKHRAELFRACLVMLRAWLLADMKPSDLEGWGGRWGSVDDWDRVVRGAIVYAGLADPIGAKGTAVAPNVKEGLADLVLGLEEVTASVGHEGEATITQIHDALADNDARRKEIRESWGNGVQPPAITFPRIRKGIASLMPQLKGNTPTGQQLGNLLGRNKAAAIPSPGGRRWIQYRHCDGGMWRVDIVAEQAAMVSPDADDVDYEAKERAAMQ